MQVRGRGGGRRIVTVAFAAYGIKEFAGVSIAPM